MMTLELPFFIAPIFLAFGGGWALGLWAAKRQERKRLSAAVENIIWDAHKRTLLMQEIWR